MKEFLTKIIKTGSCDYKCVIPSYLFDSTTYIPCIFSREYIQTQSITKKVFGGYEVEIKATYICEFHQHKVLIKNAAIERFRLEYGEEELFEYLL